MNSLLKKSQVSLVSDCCVLWQGTQPQFWEDGAGRDCEGRLRDGAQELRVPKSRGQLLLPWL